MNTISLLVTAPSPVYDNHFATLISVITSLRTLEVVGACRVEIINQPLSNDVRVCVISAPHLLGSLNDFIRVICGAMAMLWCGGVTAA